jgi:hypothetical protein
MLQYLRENKFFNDTDYYKFMRHVRADKKIVKINDIIPKELNKKEKNDEDK